MTKMGRILVWIGAWAALSSALWATAPAAELAGPAGSRTAAAVSAQYARLPLAFEENRGQTDGRVRFLARGGNYLLFLTPAEAVLELARPAGGDLPAGKPGWVPVPPKIDVLKIGLSGANPRTKIAGVDELPGRTASFIGNDSSQWRKDIPSYGRVVYEDLYPGIDLAFYGTQGQVEFDFILKPGAKPEDVSLDISGASGLSVGPEGDLALATSGGELQLMRPAVFQERNGQRTPVEGRFVLKGTRVGIALGPYDPMSPVVVDPVLVYSTYLGGSGNDIALHVFVSAAGEAYLAGFTLSADFPALGALHGTTDAYFTKFTAAGTSLAYSYYIGGTQIDQAWSIAVDSTGKVYMAGTTNSPDFPTLAALQPALAGGYDGFLCKIDPTVPNFIYSTFWGGTGADGVTAMVVDSAAEPFLAGATSSADFPHVSAAQPLYAGGTDAFVTKFNAAGTFPWYSTYLGGSASDGAWAIAVDSTGSAYVTGGTSSANFPTQVPFQAAAGGSGDAFVTRLSPSGTSFLYSTYLGGGGLDTGYGIALDGSGDIYVTGSTASSNFPVVPGSFQTTIGGGADAFVTKFSPAGSALLYSTFVGGSNNDGAIAIALDASGGAYIAGGTSSPNYPVLTPIQAALAGTINAFVTKLNPAGSALSFSTYLGGNGSDGAYSIALDPTGAMYVCGLTSSTNFPTASPLQPANHGAQDAFLAKLSAVPTLTATASATPTSGQAPLAVSFSGSASGGTTPYTYAWSFGDSATGSGATTSHTYSAAGSYPVTLTVTDAASLTATDSHLTITVTAPAALSVSATATPLSGNAPLAVSFAGTASGGVPPYTYAWTFGDSTTGAGASTSHTYTAAGTYPVILTVTDSTSAHASDNHLSISVSAPLPLTLSIAASPTSGPIPLAVSFTAMPGGGIPPYTVTWDFGDSTTGTGATTTHTYTTGGTFTIHATVTDSASMTATASATVQAINPPVISSVTKVGNPFRLKIYGSNFHGNCTVKVNGASVPLSQYKSPSLVVAKKGAALKAMVPKGVSVQITVTNNDDGGVSAPFSFTW
ncbi:MAG: PKD domain-containing protein [Acidobacteriota bacterium]